jgi:hypothetical protein
MDCLIGLNGAEIIGLVSIVTLGVMGVAYYIDKWLTK